MWRRGQVRGLAGVGRLRQWMARRPSSLRALGAPERDVESAAAQAWRSGEMDLPMGNGGYALLARLSAGGMAELFLACRRGPAGIAHPVVVKRLRPEARRDPSIVRMFLREAWISARLQHPNVIRFHDFVFHEGRHHLVVEYVPGCDLAAAARAHFAEGRPFPIEAALEIGLGVLRALGHAHALRDDAGGLVGLVHRDVSPQNVLLSLEGEIKLIDFGVAKMTAVTGAGIEDAGPLGPVWSAGGATPSSGAGTVKGKLGYVAPEQLRGQRIDARADLFAVGVILFELLTGRRLFHRKDDSATMGAVLSGEVPAIAPLRPACPALLEEAVRRALAREPEGRFETAAEMEETLAEVLASLLRAPGGRAEPSSSERGLLAGQELAALVRDVTSGRDRHRTMLVRGCRRSTGGRGRPGSRPAAASRSGEDSRPAAASRSGEDSRPAAASRAGEPSRQGAERRSGGEHGEATPRPRGPDGDAPEDASERGPGDARDAATPHWKDARPQRRVRLLPWLVIAAVTFAAGALAGRAIGATSAGASCAHRPRGESAETARSAAETHSTPPQ
ncbi:protein kinase domain-containing protein [Sorangium sp. So ce854]|uniref:serine/threonine-protein kinase n=1 Tax=Sorangium sp. So ce854 TaxID=3133322 RepID=UPI003F5EC016